MTPVADPCLPMFSDGAQSSGNSFDHHFINGGGGDTTEGNSSATAGGISPSPNPSNSGTGIPSSNGPAKAPSQQHNDHKSPPASLAKDSASQKDGLDFVQDLKPHPSTESPTSQLGPNELFFGGTDRASGLSYKDREERVRQLRERQQQERQQKLEELKEQAAAAQRFREQQETVRRQRLDEMRSKDSARRSQVEERKRIIQQAEQERRQAVLRKSAEREQRLELKRRQERSNAVFAFGSSTPRMLDPRESVQSYFGARRSGHAVGDSSLSEELTHLPSDTCVRSATSTTNVNLSESSSGVRRASECQETDLSRKRATSAHSLNRKPDDPAEFGGQRESLPEEQVAPVPSSAAKPPRGVVADLRMSTSMYEVFNWDDADAAPSKSPLQPHSSRPGEDASTTRPLVTAPPPTAARRRTDLLPAFPSLRDSAATPSKGSPRHRSPGVRSGTVTPGSPSRPTSALSQTSAGSQAILRSRTSPRKPRPLSIAGSTLSSADKPRETASPTASALLASPNRESRPIDRKSSTDSATSKPLRAKSAGSDRSAPSTPAKTPRGAMPKRTPAQVKAESAAKKAAERSKPTTKSRSTPKTTPLQSPSAESKALPGSEKKAVTKPVPAKEQKEEEKVKDTTADVSGSPEKPAEKVGEEKLVAVDAEMFEPEKSAIQEEYASELLPKTETAEEAESKPENDKAYQIEEAKEESQVVPKGETVEDEDRPDLTSIQAKQDDLPPSSDTKEEPESDKSQVALSAQRAAEKPVTGYASEEEYKAAIAEKRRQVREAKERELELERERQLEEEERERREEEEYLRLMEEQRKAEEDRLQKAILEAERQREEEVLRKEEEERQRLEAEKIEQQKKLEAEEKMRKEEEERQMRKSRVAAIMSRTRGKGSISTPSKTESKTPSEESKMMSESLMSTSMTENLINNISSSMTDSMIVQAIESHEAQKTSIPQPAQSPGNEAPPFLLHQTVSNESQAAMQTPTPSSVTVSSSQFGSTVTTDSSSPFQLLVDTTHTETQILSSQIIIGADTVTESRTVVVESSEELVPAVDSISLLQDSQVNGNTALPVPMDTTPTSQSVDLLSSFNGVNGISHNGMDSGSFQSTGRPDNQFGSLDPLNTPLQTIQTSTTEAKTDTSTFDQIIDLNQTKLTNEDAVNSNPPASIIAFEDNLNKKSQQQSRDKSSNVPDLLL